MVKAEKIVKVSSFTNGILGPSVAMLGPVENGGNIIYNTSPGCWGPMITPKLRGGHEVCSPVAVEGAEVGDSIAIRVEGINVKSKASSSGTDEFVEGAFIGDPFVVKKCPGCGALWPETVLEEGLGIEGIKCENCGRPVSPFRMVDGYTMVFDSEKKMGLTINRDWATRIARQAKEWGAIPTQSRQFSILIAAKADIVGVVTRVRPMIGQLGTTPSVDMPDSHNAGDFGTFLIDASHQYSLKKDELERSRTDGHLDIDSVRPGAILICPVKIKGGGVYAGDVHALQGDGEVAGHTVDVASEVNVKVGVVKKLSIEGPILLPPVEDLPYLVRPYTEEEWERAQKLAKEYDVTTEELAPIQVIGTGPTINEAADNGFRRASKLLKISYDEVRNRVTITGGVEIGRLPGVVQINILAPIERLEEIGIAKYVREQYNLQF